jgi:uncharacterized protein (DUF885 family)
VADDINTLAEEYFEFQSRIGPTSSHMRGDYRYLDRFEDLSRGAEDEEIATRRSFVARAAAIDPGDLHGDDVTTREALIFDAETAADFRETRQAEFGVDPTAGLQAMLPVILPQMTVETPEHADLMVDKFRAIATAYDQLTDRIREGVVAGRTPAEFAITKTVAQLDAILDTPIEDDPLLNVQVPSDFDAQAAAWKSRLGDAVAKEIRPAMRRQRDAIRDEVAPNARRNDRAGVMWLPDGEVIYSRAIHRYTTLPMQAGEIHEVGLQQIARLEDEYRVLGSSVLGTNDVAAIYQTLREDPDLHHTSGEDVVTASETAMQTAKAEMGSWFGRLPYTDCVVRETKSGPIAFYFPPALDGTRPGVFFMNTVDPTSWGRFEIECTSFHEGIPGHHLQIAIAQELGDQIPSFRQHGYIAAFSEGWGLYTERLADEMGLYSSPLDRMGMLAADSMRACRLVVDTGMHALGWSREDAIGYLTENSPMSLHSITEEVDRYLVMPGQALSYMIGRLEIERLRADAAAALGDRFDIKGFHDTVIGSASVPLESLDRLVGEWTARQ